MKLIFLSVVTDVNQISFFYDSSDKCMDTVAVTKCSDKVFLKPAEFLDTEVHAAVI